MKLPKASSNFSADHDSLLVTPASDSNLNETKSNTPGAFPETPANEDESFGVNPLPPTEGASNPVNPPAGSKIPPLGEITSNTIHSSVTTSQSAYEKAGSSIPYLGGALAALGFGGTAAKKENLIPESSLPMGENADKSLDAGPTVSSSGANTTTADLAGKVPLEESKPTAAIGSSSEAPVSEVPEPVKESIKEAHAEPEATASSEAVKEKSAVEQELLEKVPTSDETGEHAPSIAAATATSTSPVSAVPEPVAQSIAEAHADPEAAASAEVVKEKSAVEEELLKKVPTTDATGEHAPTIAAGAAAGVAVGVAAGAAAATSTSPVSAVPETVTESIAEAHADPEATTSAEAVKEKSAVEQELLKKVPEHDETGEPAPTIAAATSATAPAPTTETSSATAPGQSSTAAAALADGADAEPVTAAKTTVVPEKSEADNTEYAPPPHAAGTAPGVSSSAAAAISDGAEDPTLLDEPAVQLGIQNDAEAVGTTAPTTEATTADTPKETIAPTTAAPESKKEVPSATPAAPASATPTPQKPAATTPSSTPASSSSATKDKKKKHRVSSFFKKIFD